MKILSQEEFEGLSTVHNDREFVRVIKKMEVGQSIQISLEELNGCDPHYPVVAMWRMGKKLTQKKLREGKGFVYTRLS